MLRKHYIIFALICLAIFLWGFLCDRALGSSYTLYAHYPTSGGADSVRTVWLRLGATLIDSASNSSFPATRAITLDNQYFYTVQSIFFSGAASDTVVKEWVVPQTETLTVTSYNHLFRFYSGNGADSVKVRWRRDGNSLVDSFWVTSFPFDTLVSGFDPDYFYKLEYLWLAGGDTTATDGIVLPMVAQGSGGGSGGGGGCGDGPVEVTFHAVDTSGTDSLVSGVIIGLTNLSTGDELMGPTNGTGHLTFGLWAADYRAISYKSGYWFAIDTFTILNDEDSLAVLGYDLASTYTVTAQVATVTVNVKLSSGRPAQGVNVSAYITAPQLADSSGAVILPAPQTHPTDSLGQVTFQCIWSSYLIPATKWRFTATLPSGTKKVDVTIPRQATYTIDFTE